MRVILSKSGRGETRFVLTYENMISRMNDVHTENKEKVYLMHKTRNSLPEEQRTKLVEVLNRRLADSIDLMLQAKQAHWNVNGPQFMVLHTLFGQIACGVEVYVDLL